MKIKEIRALSASEAGKLLRETQAKLQQARFLLAVGGNKKVHEVRQLKRLIARLRTLF